MGSKLLVRSYNVGCGDCIYVRIPNGADGFHILIDCGSKEKSPDVLERAIKHLETQLPLDETDSRKKRKRLDMIVLTHRHEDHIKGFDPDYFKNIAIRNIWITAAMDEKLATASQARELHAFAEKGMKGLADSGAALSPELEDLAALYGIRNDGATDALTNSLPRKNGIDPKFVYAGQTSDDFGIKIKNTKLKVLGPEKDIDGFYLGKEANEQLRGLQAGGGDFNKKAKSKSGKPPTNISSGDFRNLQKRVLSNALAFAVDDSEIQNNVSTVILIEWGKRRLLFVGDAEFRSGFRQGRKNGSWNVMWNQRKEDLEKPVDFIKIGHHGSHNATPWHRKARPGKKDEVNEIFDSILPIPKTGKPKAKCVVSTKRKQYDTIPDGELLVEIGKRVSNTKNYLREFKKQDPNFEPSNETIFNYSVMKKYSKEPLPREVGDKPWLDKPQPIRTDMESAGKASGDMLPTIEFVDVEIDP